MTTTLFLSTSLGPFQPGSKLVVDIPYAQQLLRRFGNTVQVTRSPDGNTLFISAPMRPPVSQEFNVKFASAVFDPSTSSTFVPGKLYRFSYSGLRRLYESIGGIAFLDSSGNIIPLSNIRSYVGQTITVDQVVYARGII